MNAKLQELNPVQAQFIEANPVEDDISLVDIWITVTRFKKVFLTTLLIVSIAGVTVVGFTVGDKFTMNSIINIGMVEQDSRLAPIETPQSVVAKLNLSILPGLTRSYVASRDLQYFRTSVMNPKDTNLIVISNIVDGSDNEIIAEFQKKLVERIVDDHKKMFNYVNQELRSTLAFEQKTLSELENPLKAMELTADLRVELTEKQQELNNLVDKSLQENIKQGYKNEIEIVENRIQTFYQQVEALESQLESGTGNASRKVFRVNIAENHLEINNLRNGLRTLQQKLDGHEQELKNRISSQQLVIEGIKNKIKIVESDLEAQIAFQKANLRGIEQELENEGSRSSVIAELSLEPVGFSKNTALLLVVAVAVIAAFLAMLIAVFSKKVNERIAEGVVN